MIRVFAIAMAGVTWALALTVGGEMNFDRNRLVFNERDGMTFVSLERYTSTWETGAPSLPVAVAQYVVPPDMKVVAVRLDVIETETIPGTFDIYPVQQPQPLSAPGPSEFTPADPKYYGAIYPGKVAVGGHQGSMFGYNIASVFIAPVQYDGSDKSLVFHPLVRFTIELETADLGYLRPGNRSPGARHRVEAQVASIVLNPEDVGACAPR